MRKSIILFLSLLAFSFGSGQASLKSDFDKAVKLLKAQDYQNAEKGFSEVLSKTTDKGLKKYCLIYRAFSYNGLGYYAKAIADLDKAIELDSSDVASYVDRGKVKAYIDDLEGAKQDFLHVLGKDSISEQGGASLFYLGKIAYQQGEFEKSIKYCDKYLLMDRNDPEVYFNRGAAKDMIMDPAGSIKDYDMAIQLDSTYAEAYANRGVAKINLQGKKGNIQLTKEQAADACADLRKAKQLGDNTVDDMIFVHCGNK